MHTATGNRASHRKAKPMICIIEDNADTRASLKDALERDGFDVFATGDGRDGLEHLRSAPTTDALLLDLYMPGLTGFEIYAALRNDRQLSSIPVIVVTAASPAHRTGLDVAATIRKPLDLQELLFTVHRAIATGDRPLQESRPAVPTSPVPRKPGLR